MNCKRCGETGAERLEVQFQNGSALKVYLCGRWANTERQRDGVRELVTAPEQ